MGRGRRSPRPGVIATHRRGASAPPTDPHGPWADPELPTTLPALLELVERERVATLRDQALERLADYGEIDRPPDVGVALPEYRADRGTFIPLLAAVALHAADPDDPQITEILTQIRRVQRRHMAALSARGPDGTFDPNSPISVLYGLRASGESTRERDRQSIFADLAHQRDIIDGYLAGTASSVEVIARMSREANLAAAQQALDGVLARLLCTGAERRLVQELLSALPAWEGAPTQLAAREEDWAAVIGVARLRRATGAINNWRLTLTDPLRIRGEVRSTAAHARRMRDAGTNADYFWMRSAIPDCERAEDAIALAHGLLREANSLSQPPADGSRAVTANVVVSEGAFADLVARFANEPTWGGVQALIVDPQEPDSPNGGGSHMPEGAFVQYGAAACVSADIGGAPVAVRFVLMLGAGEAPTADAIAAPVRDALDALAARHDADPAPMRLRSNPHGARVAHWGLEPVRRGAERTPHERPGPRVSGRADLLGPERCDHEDATWVHEEPAWGLPDYLRLSCRRCLRHQAAIAPSHADPQREPLMSLGTYVAACRGLAAFHGEREPEDLTLDDLIARDAHVSLNPADHAIDLSPTPTRRVGTRRPGILGGAR